MLHRIVTRITGLAVCILFPFALAAQKVALTDARETGACEAFHDLVESMPKEVLFGVHLQDDGSVYFSIGDITWFNKLFTSDKDGITIDLVSKEQYHCDKPVPEHGLGKGVLLPPVYLPALKKNMADVGGNQVSIRIGTIPAHLRGKELEGNLVLIKNGVVCYYTYFTDIPRSQWLLLPMGLYTDTLLKYETDEADPVRNLTKPLFYTRKLQFSIPFEKGHTQFNKADLQPLYDSLKLTQYSIRSIDIRAYSSVEGASGVNTSLQQQRAESIVKALQQFQTPEIMTHISSSENWLEFMHDIRNTAFSNLASLGRPDIKTKLLDKTLLAQLEPVLKQHRKAIVTIYLNPRNGLEKTNSDTLLTRFQQAIKKKNTAEASIIQQAIFERVAGGKLPYEYIDKLEIPREGAFSNLLNNQTSYKFMLNLTTEVEALLELKEIEKYAPRNARIKYNICALTLHAWQYDSSFVLPGPFLNDINALPKYGIPASLVKRMLVNYHIMISEIYMERGDYEAKDDALSYIKTNYTEVPLEDKDLLALAKYLCHYAQCDWSLELLVTRASKIDVDEDLLFYFLNLLLFHSNVFEQPLFQTPLLNAIAINRARFCRLFNAVGKGGTSFQLLGDPTLRKVYCETCDQ